MTTKDLITIITVIIAAIIIGLGMNALTVWIVCKCLGIAFAWKWVILFTVAYTVLAGLFRNARDERER